MRKLFLSILLILLLATKINVFADDVSRAHVFVDAEVLTAALLNGEFDPIVTALNDVTGAQLKSDIAITTSGAMAISGTSAFTGTFSATGTSINLGNGGSDVLTINAAGGLTFTPAATWTFTGAQTVSGTWANLGTVTTGTFAALLASANLDIGSYDFRAQTLTSDVATGTAPIVVSSTTKVANLNSDYLDGYHAGISAAATVIYVSGADGYMPDNTTDTTALKTTTGEVSSGSTANLLLPGGTYGFYPQIKTSGSSMHAYIGFSIANSTYITNINFQWADGTNYAQQRYVTASGEDWFVFLKVNKSTGEIESLYSAADHPSYGTGGDYNKIPCPSGFDEPGYEVVLVGKDTVRQLQEESTDIDEETGVKRLATLINTEYKPDMNKEEVYQPLHSGKYKKILENGKEVVTKQMVESIPDFIKVRKLEKLTQVEKDQRENKRQQAIQKAGQAKQKKEQDKISAENKLKALGLSEDEIISITK